MKHKESYREFVERVESSVEYKVEVAALEFVNELVRCMGQANINQAELARCINASEPYISKVLRGDTNFTLTTMIKLADAVGQELHLHIARPESTVHWRDVFTTLPKQLEWPKPAKPCRDRHAQESKGNVYAKSSAAA